MFRNFYQKVLSTLTDSNIQEFEDLKTHSERISFLYELKVIHDYPITAENCCKNLNAAQKLKQDGNTLFKRSKFAEALNLYSQCILQYLESSDCAELAIMYANRSACLYHLEEYQLCIRDVDKAFELHYPHDLAYKLHERKARCFIRVGKKKPAISSLRMTLEALKKANMKDTAKENKRKEIDDLLKTWSKQKFPNDTHANGKLKEKLFQDKNAMFPRISSAIEIKYSDRAGRYAQANSDVPVGEVIVTEKPYCSVLLQENQHTHCFQCFQRVKALEPCPRCDQVVFCSQKCRDLALKTHHSVECGILSSLWSSGLSVTAHMALRIISQKNLSYFLQIKNILKKRKFSNKMLSKKYSGTDYADVYCLVTHEERRQCSDILQRTCVAIFLLRCLQRANYFQPHSCSAEVLSEDELYVAELLLHNIQFLQFNAHEISEIQIVNNDVVNCQSAFLGGAVYPTLALFNHSCNPSLVRYFNGTMVVARAIKNIKKGETVCENYGPIFTQTVRQERQETLLKQYWFKCECEPCSEDWPIMEVLEKSSDMRFRCNNASCCQPVIVPQHTMSHVAVCKKCGCSINILLYLKTLQKTQSSFQKATELMKKCEVQAALLLFTEVLNILEKILVPPFADFHRCQQALRTCYLTYGNVNHL